MPEVFVGDRRPEIVLPLGAEIPLWVIGRLIEARGTRSAPEEGRDGSDPEAVPADQA
jgi:hypothetical protein